ncbi:MAG: hypothetical protein LQ338_000643 [Usnochroma carphineum]|nr:MAG: hypothetical protein LQ338_000643 [Usnochroma carphineum]
MSDQVQVFWDPYLQAFVIELLNRNRSPSAASPIVVTPDDFQAPPTRTASFVMNPNAPLGSFRNPIPHSSEPATIAVKPTPVATPTPATQASAHPPLWPQMNTAPLGSFLNPFPHRAFMPLGNATTSPPPAPGPAPTPTSSSQAQPPTVTPDQGWQPTAAEVDALFGPPPLNPSTPDEAPQHPVPVTSHPTPASATSSRDERHTRTPGPRRVHFQDEEARVKANEDAAARAAAQARQNEAEVLDFTDADPARRLHSTRRKPPTPMPSTTFPIPPPAPVQSTSRPLQPESRNSSAGSFIDPLGGEGQYERWPLCTVCEDRPVMIRKNGIGFCDACFGQACAAEEVRKRADRRG